MSGVNSSFICGISRFKENRFGRKTSLGINYFNKTTCEEFFFFFTYERYFKENNIYYSRSRVASSKHGNPENLRSEAG